MRVALVHDWLVGMRGGEKVLDAFCELYPGARLFTLLHQPGACSPRIEALRPVTSFIDRLPFARSRYRYYLPLFPHAIESFDLSEFDLVLSSSHCVAKGVITPPRATHVCYIHTPMRYVWDQYQDYFGPGRGSPLKRFGARLFSTYLRNWDEASAPRVDRYIANSANVAARVEKRYRREAWVALPPVDLERFTPRSEAELGDYYLIVSAFAPYKRVDVAIEALGRMGRALKIVGSGEDEPRLRALARSYPKVELLGSVREEEVTRLFERCRALIFPGEEDAGITPMEAQAAGRPVIALGRGGALELVRPLGEVASPTGLFFQVEGSITAQGTPGFESAVRALSGAVERYEANRAAFEPAAARANAERFGREQFKRRIGAMVERAVEERQRGLEAGFERARREAGEVA